MIVQKFNEWSSLKEFTNKQIFVEFPLNEDVQVDPKDNLTSEIRKKAQVAVERVITYMGRGGKVNPDGTRTGESGKKFANAFLIKCRIIWDHPRVSTMATDGYNLFICSKFVANPFNRGSQMTDDEIAAILCHEMFHIALLHMRRQRLVVGEKPDKKMFGKWNKACDYEINPILIDEGLLTVEGLQKLKGLYNEKYIGLSAEEIFKQIDSTPMPQPDDDKKEEEKEKEYVQPKIGDFIKTKDGKIGKITKIDDDGSVEFDELSDEEISRLKEMFKEASSNQ